MDYSPPASLSTEFSRQEYWIGLPFPTPGDLPNSGITPASLASPPLAGRFFTIGTTWEVSNLLEAEQFPCYTEQDTEVQRGEVICSETPPDVEESGTCCWLGLGRVRIESVGERVRPRASLLGPLCRSGEMLAGRSGL